MSMEFAPNKMMTEAPDKKVFHFSGDGIWRNKAIIAETREEAEKIWHAAKELVNPSISLNEVDTTAAVDQAIAAPEQSTAAPANASDAGAVQ